MASLREIKDRIGSVRSTLKVTSAMKLVSSAKLRKAQKAIEGMRPYEEALSDILSHSGLCSMTPTMEGGKVAVVAIASNNSLCGGFNSNAVRKTMEVIGKYGAENVQVFALGRKIADPLKRAGFESESDFCPLVAHTSYESISTLSHSLIDRFNSGEFSKVVLVYNRFVSTSRQVPTEELYLPYTAAEASAAAPEAEGDYILEPGAAQIAETLLPMVLSLKFYAAVLDSVAAEHAARTIAMQTATDNAENLLGELTLEYNKGRQQKITSEILDLLGGSSEQ